MRTLGSASVVVAETVAVAILVGRFGDIGGWDAAQVAWLVGVSNAGLGLGMLVGDAIEPPAFLEPDPRGPDRPRARRGPCRRCCGS